jgi:hypothetical protein
MPILTFARAKPMVRTIWPPIAHTVAPYFVGPTARIGPFSSVQAFLVIVDEP